MYEAIRLEENGALTGIIEGLDSLKRELFIQLAGFSGKEEEV